MDTESQIFRLHRKDIAYFKFIIESYDGMAVVRTKDPHEAIVELMVAPGWERDLDEVMEGLRKEIQIEPLSLVALIRHLLNFEVEIPMSNECSNVRNEILKQINQNDAAGGDEEPRS